MASLILRTVGVSLLALGLLSSGCGDERATLLIRGVALGTLDTTNGICRYESSASQAFDGQGAVYSSYVAYDRTLVIQNQLSPSVNAGEYRPETNAIVLKDAEITVRSSDGSTISKFKVPVAGVVDPGQQLSAVRVTLLDTVAMQALVASKVSDATIGVKLNGQTNASISVTSGDLFSFPVRVSAYVPPVREAGAPIPTSSDGGTVPSSDTSTPVAPPQGPGCI